jgi:predicted nucleotidyltransferase
MKITDEQLTRWAKAPSETEEDKCRVARDRIEKALRAVFGDSIRVFLQGSYKNRTNVKRESDVDIVVEYTGTYFHELHLLSPQELQRYWGLHVPVTYPYHQFKTDVTKILTDEFEDGEVERVDKCIKVYRNDQRVHADIIPSFTHNCYATATVVKHKGIHFVTDAGVDTFNYPEQHHDNGEAKNVRTKGKFKDIVRILKNIKYDLVDADIMKEKDMPSYFIESLVWNLSDPVFYGAQNSTILRSALIQLYSDMKNAKRAGKYREIHNLRYLLPATGYSAQQAQTFIKHAWVHVGFS